MILSMKTLSASDLQMFLNDKRCLLIDVREEEEWADGHIEGATHAPLSNFMRFAPIIIEKQQETDAVIFYCKGGVRSTRAIEFLESTYGTNDKYYNLEDGYVGYFETIG